MEKLDQYREKIQKIKGKTIALVYIFEGDDSSGFSHFFIWKSKILSKWMNAIEDLHCLPFLIDVRTFVNKAMNHTLPHIDYVLNMNSGTCDLSTMALVPATCSALGVPCIPCNAVTIVTGENKKLSNYIATAIGINVPRELPVETNGGIYRPLSLGNSLGVTIGMNPNDSNGIYQEFIPGYDITTPIVYNGITQQMELLPTVLYIPDSFDPHWFNGENVKRTRSGYHFKIASVDQRTAESYLKLVKTLSIQTFCRIDARVRCSYDKFSGVDHPELTFDDIYFVEINVMPTIRDNNNFAFSHGAVREGDKFFPCVTALEESLEETNVYNFLLANSMMSFL